MSLSDAHWDADIHRLADSIGLPKPRARWPLAAGAAVLAAALVGGWAGAAPQRTARSTRAAARPMPARGCSAYGGAPVRYDWGDRHAERFEFKRHAGELTGTASFLAYPRAIEKLRVDGRTCISRRAATARWASVTREVTRSYSAELRGQPPDEVLAFRMLSSGGFSSDKPIEFEARRVQP